MNFKKLSKLIFDDLKLKLEKHGGLLIFARERAKFEGWLKVEMCDSLSKYFNDVRPEHNRVDITFDDWAIELKTLNTNIRYNFVINKNRPITKNTQGVIKDIKKLQGLNFINKAVLFITFPIEHNNQYWEKQLTRIKEKLSDIEYCQFNFRGGIVSGVIYFGKIN